MSKSECISCRKPTATMECGVCSESVCKKCAQMMGFNAFEFLDPIPAVLKHPIYCSVCFDRDVVAEAQSYQETMERAKRVAIFFKSSRKKIPLLKRSKFPLSISACEDRDQIILWLAFKSATQGFNAVTDVDVNYKKVRDEGLQNTVWSATGCPAQIDESWLDREDLREEMYR